MLQNPYLYLTLISFAAQIWAAHRLRQDMSVPGAKLCLFFLFVSYTMTVLELYSYYQISTGLTHINTTLCLRVYYGLVCTFLLTLPLLLNQIIQLRKSPIILFINLITFGCIVYLTLFTNTIIIDAKVLTYTITRVKGDHYWLMLLFVLYSLFTTLLNLWQSYTNPHNPLLAKLKSVNLIIGFIPLLAVIFVVIVLMELGLPINAAGTTPIALSLLILIMAENLRSDRILDLRVYIPWSAQAKMIRQLTKPFREVTLAPETAKGLSIEYDKSLIITAKKMFPTQKDAAAWLGITESKMSRMLKK